MRRLRVRQVKVLRRLSIEKCGKRYSTDIEVQEEGFFGNVIEN